MPATIYTPNFHDTPEKRAEILKLVDAAVSTLGKPVTDVFTDIHNKFSADWNVVRTILTEQRTNPLPNVDFNGVGIYTQFDDKYILSLLAKALRQEWHDFAVFAKLFKTCAITVHGVREVIERNKALLAPRYSINYNELIERIAFIENASAENIIKAAIPFTGFVMALTNFSYRPCELDSVNGEFVIFDTSDEWADLFGFDFGQRNFEVTIESHHSLSAYTSIESTWVSNILEFVSNEDVTEQYPLMRGNFLVNHRELLRSCLYGNIDRAYQTMKSASITH
jgi:hypothetical protein